MNLGVVLKKYWGFDGFRPHQEQAMKSVLQGRDSLVVLPTGGGKSLCYQAPALLLPGMAVVISPLISLMKDQVDALRSNGMDAACLNSGLDASERSRVMAKIQNRDLKILYIAPERLGTEGFMTVLRSQPISFFAVDEAHCISMWGHDFRPEYRTLKLLRHAFPGIAIHAYTATATRQVQADIVQALGLDNAETLVGSFDRPNLIYKVERRAQRIDQVIKALDPHKEDSCIIYCLRRSDVDSLTASLTKNGYKAKPYHAGLSDKDRKDNQDAFLQEDINIIVATVAFGMGIDKSNVRCVIHANAPKSLEHYQQETGRAGRDGLEAECRLFYSGSDFITWRRFIDEMEPEPRAVALQKLNDMSAFCMGTTCRHRALVAYFDPSIKTDSGNDEKCDACDACLGQLQLADAPLIVAQKILSCVIRLSQSFGAGYTARVLCGSKDKRIREGGHDQLSTYGLLAEESSRNVRDWIEQLVEQAYLIRTGDFNVLKLTQKGRLVLKGEATPILLKPADTVTRPDPAAKVASESWEGVDKDLFAKLRDLRRTLARQLSVPAFVVFSDAALRDMARRKPATAEEFLDVYGVGQKKCQEFGPVFLECIRNYTDSLSYYIEEGNNHP
ncbi:MAG: DNA helicase RecQ [Planctomycetota bacterium]